MSLRSIRFCLWALSLVMLVSTAQAQSTARARITTPQIELFPLVEFYLDVYTADGNFLHGLQPSQVTILEDEQPARDPTFQEIRPGVQLVVAINPGSAIALRNSQGVSRYGLIRQALAHWATTRAGSSIDDLSVLITDGSGLSHTNDLQTWLAAFPEELSDARQAVPSLDNLSQAVDLAADPTHRSGMGRAVLWITPALDSNQILALDDIISRANQQDIKIFIWLVTPGEVVMNPANQKLNELALQTGGQFFAYTGSETLPDLETYLEPLRSIYRLSYTSQVRQSGSHQVSVEIQTEGETISSPLQSYTISLQHPNPAFINPPLEIIRQPPEHLTGVASTDIAIEDYSPDALTLEILVDFPDQRMRSLVRTALLVDGSLVDENLTPPFDTFQWDLRQIAQNGDHSLQVIAEDILGLSGSSINTIIRVEVKQPATGFWIILARNTPTLIGLAVLLVSGVVLLLMVVGGRIHPRSLPLSRLQRPVKKSSPEHANLPAEQQSPSWTSRLHWPQRRLKPRAEAYLTPLASDDSLEVAVPIALSAPEITIGSDPQRATVVLDDPSVDGLHARLVKNEAGIYILNDAGSTAGTWVNYTILPKDGICLEHNDLIHIGRSHFRFTQAHPTQIRKPIIRRLDIEVTSTLQSEDK